MEYIATPMGSLPNRRGTIKDTQCELSVHDGGWLATQGHTLVENITDNLASPDYGSVLLQAGDDRGDNAETHFIVTLD